MEVVTRLPEGGIRFEQHGSVLSELPRQPGPTHSIFDVLAAAVHLFAPGPRLALLGFAAGGMIAPLRRFASEHVVSGVDLSDRGYQLFCEVASGWRGSVSFERADALAWIRSREQQFDAVVEDLSVSRANDIVKPAVCWGDLPAAIYSKLAPRGLSVVNLLPTPGITWNDLIASCSVARGVLVQFEHFHNRILITGAMVGDARTAGRNLRATLRILGSETADSIEVRTLTK